MLNRRIIFSKSLEDENIEIFEDFEKNPRGKQRTFALEVTLSNFRVLHTDFQVLRTDFQVL